MNRVTWKTIVSSGVLLVVVLAGQGCSNRHRLTSPDRTDMEKYAEERYSQALLYMEASRFELARQQFAIVEKSAVSVELRDLAHEGYSKATAVIETKR